MGSYESVSTGFKYSNLLLWDIFSVERIFVANVIGANNVGQACEFA
jgi:hypothetical protein